MRVQFGCFLGFHLLNLTQIQRLTGGARIQTLEAQDESRSLMNEVGAAAQQIAHRPQLGIVHMRLRQNVQSLQIGQMKRIVLIVNVLDAIVLLNFRRIGQVYRIAFGTQSVQQPIPIESGLDRHGLELGLERLQELDHLLQIALQLAMHDPFAILVYHTDHYVVAVQVESCD